MGVIAWILLGLVAGFIGNRLMGPTSGGLLTDIVLGIVGAIVGGFIMATITGVGVTGFNIWSILVAVIGAVVVQWLYRQFTGRSI
ncbi:GlsB/YeaQ/YmgE family stress response membrane protein [Salmonella enterica subsp. enterica]|nr:GlsB/YeaQ/YmgE family stress response membrane protein [Salmonella enterica subsp. enterica serovar Paratyphi A]